MATKVEQLKRTSILLAAIGHYAGKVVNRSHLVDGSDTPIKAEISGSVGRASVSLAVGGILSVGSPATVAKSVAPDTTTLVACLLAELPSDTERAKVMAKYAKHYAETKSLPDPGKAMITTAKAWLKGMRSTTPQTKAGSVSFAPEE